MSDNATDLPSGPIPLKRAVEGVQIPAGSTVLLDAGLEASITQSLGGTYTVATSRGLYRIDGKDADALGLEPLVGSTSAHAEFSEQAVWDALKTCFDPEIPVNIVDLGLVYDMKALDHPTGGRQIDVQMTLTAPGCGMGPSIAADAQRKIIAVPGVKEANVSIVWEPAWTPQMISEEGKKKLGMA